MRVRVYVVAALVEADALTVDRLQERGQEQPDRPCTDDVDAAGWPQRVGPAVVHGPDGSPARRERRLREPRD